MFDRFSFLTKIRLAANLRNRIQERYEHASFTAQEKQEETELHDALQENQSMEKKQMEMVEKSQTEQKEKEKTLESAVRFPEDEAFKRKCENAKLYAFLLAERTAQERRNKQTMMQSVEDVIKWQKQDKKDPPKNQQIAMARFYVRTHLSRG